MMKAANGAGNKKKILIFVIICICMVLLSSAVGGIYYYYFYKPTTATTAAATKSNTNTPVANSTTPESAAPSVTPTVATNLTTINTLCPAGSSSGCLSMDSSGKPSYALGLGLQTGSTPIRGGTVTITFATPFPVVPIVVGTAYQSGLNPQSYSFYVHCNNVTTNSATFLIQYRGQNSSTINICDSPSVLNWMAVRPS